MHFINPFKGLRPTEEKASSVSIPSTDHLSEEVITKHKKNNPWSYLNIFSNKILKAIDIQLRQYKSNNINSTFQKMVVNSDNNQFFYEVRSIAI